MQRCNESIFSEIFKAELLRFCANCELLVASQLISASMQVNGRGGRMTPKEEGL